APGLSAKQKPAATTQQKPAAQTAAKPAAQKPAAQKPAAATAQATKPAAKSAANKPSKKPAAPTRAAADQKPAEGAPDTSKVARRDPFESMLARQQSAANQGKNLPPGKAGLQVSTLRVDGIVKATNGMIAVVSNPQSRTYFLREGDRLYD